MTDFKQISASSRGIVDYLAPKRVAGLGGLMECQSCGGVGSLPKNIRHRNESAHFDACRACRLKVIGIPLPGSTHPKTPTWMYRR
jgi:hypothetical protein